MPVSSTCSDPCLEHQVELTRLGQVAVGCLAGPLARLAAAAHLLVLRVGDVVCPEAELAGAAVDERIGEAGHVARGLPHARVQDERGVERDDVFALLHHRLEPAGLHVLLEEDAVVTIVVRRAEPAIDLGRREDEPAAPRERDDLVHGHDVGHPRDVTRVRARSRASDACLA